MSAAVALAPNRYSRVHLNTASLNNAPPKTKVDASLKGYSLHCIIFRTATEPSMEMTTLGNILLTYSLIQTKHSGYIPTDERWKKYRFDIHALNSCHVETVVLLERKD